MMCSHKKGPSFARSADVSPNSTTGRNSSYAFCSGHTVYIHLSNRMVTSSILDVGPVFKVLPGIWKVAKIRTPCVESVCCSIHDHDLGYVFGHSLFAGKTGISREEQQNAERASSPKWLFLRLASRQALLLLGPTDREIRGGKHHEKRVSCLHASGSAENAPMTGKRFSKPRSGRNKRFMSGYALLSFLGRRQQSGPKKREPVNARCTIRPGGLSKS